VSPISETRTRRGLKKGGVVTGNQEAGHEEHMANTEQDRVMCSNTKQTKKHETTIKQTLTTLKG